MAEHTRTTFDQLIERTAYPTNTATLIEFLRQHGTGDDVVALAATLPPDHTFKSPDEVRRALEEAAA